MMMRNASMIRLDLTFTFVDAEVDTGGYHGAPDPSIMPHQMIPFPISHRFRCSQCCHWNRSRGVPCRRCGALVTTMKIGEKIFESEMTLMIDSSMKIGQLGTFTSSIARDLVKTIREKDTKRRLVGRAQLFHNGRELDFLNDGTKRPHVENTIDPKTITLRAYFGCVAPLRVVMNFVKVSEKEAVLALLASAAKAYVDIQHEESVRKSRSKDTVTSIETHQKSKNYLTASQEYFRTYTAGRPCSDLKSVLVMLGLERHVDKMAAEELSLGLLRSLTVHERHEALSTLPFVSRLTLMRVLSRMDASSSDTNGDHPLLRSARAVADAFIRGKRPVDQAVNKSTTSPVKTDATIVQLLHQINNGMNVVALNIATYLLTLPYTLLEFNHTKFCRPTFECTNRSFRRHYVPPQNAAAAQMGMGGGLFANTQNVSYLMSSNHDVAPGAGTVCFAVLCQVKENASLTPIIRQHRTCSFGVTSTTISNNTLLRTAPPNFNEFTNASRTMRVSFSSSDVHISFAGAMGRPASSSLPGTFRGFGGGGFGGGDLGGRMVAHQKVSASFQSNRSVVLGIKLDSNEEKVTFFINGMVADERRATFVDLGRTTKGAFVALNNDDLHIRSVRFPKSERHAMSIIESVKKKEEEMIDSVTASVMKKTGVERSTAKRAAIESWGVEEDALSAALLMKPDNDDETKATGE